MEKLFEHPLTEVEKLPSTYNDKDILYLGESKLNIPYLFGRSVGVGTQLIGPIQLHVKRQNSSICNFFQDNAWIFSVPVSGKICRSPFKKVKRQPNLIILFSQHSSFFEGQSKKFKLKPDLGSLLVVCDKIVHTKMHFSASP